MGMARASGKKAKLLSWYGRDSRKFLERTLPHTHSIPLGSGSAGNQKTVMERKSSQRGKLMRHLSLFQGSKGDPGLTGPTGAAGLPVSLQGLEVSFCLPPAPTPAQHSPEPGAHTWG